MPPPLIDCRAIHKTHRSGAAVHTVLAGADLQINAGEIVAVTGASGSGKTTLLHIIGGIDAPDSGAIHYQGAPLATKTETELTQWRNRHIAFIFQFHLLLPEFTAQENAAMPLLLRRAPPPTAMATAMQSLRALDMQTHAHKTPDKLSGGERQRVAVARAITGGPSLILADEPTGNLDRQNADLVFAALLTQCRTRNTALLLATHDPHLTPQTDRTLTLTDGKLT